MASNTKVPDQSFNEQASQGSSASNQPKALPKLTTLTAEEVAHVTSFLPQADLLNMSLTCKALRHHAEPALYREYVQPHRNPLSSSVDRIIARPDIAEKYVKRVELHSWTTQDTRPRPRALPQEDYVKYTEAAKAAQVIDFIVPYGAAGPVRAPVPNYSKEK